MTQSSCIRHPQSSRFIQLHEWQVTFCQGNHCAALLLSFFSSWHGWKIQHDEYYRKFNDISQAHGDDRPHNEDAYLFFTMDNLVKALMGLFAKKSISEGIQLLSSLGVITIHANPNPRYCFDKTKYFKFYPNICNQWLEKGSSEKGNEESNTQAIDNSDNAEINNRSSKNALPPGENKRPSLKSARYIRNNNTSNTTNYNQSINAHDEIFHGQEKFNTTEEVKSIIDTLIKLGMPVRRFYLDAVKEIDRLQKAGATLEIFLSAYDISVQATQGRGFGIPYLAKVVQDLLWKSSNKNQIYKPDSLPKNKDNFRETRYESDTRNALKWIQGDEDACYENRSDC